MKDTIEYFRLIVIINIIFIFRTKWKRQNQLRLEQFRHQAVLEKEFAVTDHNGNTYCPPAAFASTTSCNFLTSAAAAALFRSATYTHGCPL